MIVGHVYNVDVCVPSKAWTPNRTNTAMRQSRTISHDYSKHFTNHMKIDIDTK